MAKRKEFKNIANGLARSFVSRNNDVYGYWGIGKLYSHMVSTNSLELKIDLVARTIEPYNDEFEILINEFADRLLSQMEKRYLNHGLLKEAEISMTGYPNNPSPHFGKMAPNKISCKMSILDDLNRKYTGEASTWCRKHNPRNESKSTRKY